jgi:membrane associated rhomboid family serine protease
MSVLEKRRTRKIFFGDDNDALMMLIFVNAIVFVILQFIKSFYYIGGLDMAAFIKNVQNWFILPADAEKLAVRPWTLLSYMFTHTSVWKLLGSMLWLWAFGYVLQDLTGNRKIFPLYLYGGLVGALFFLAAYNLVPRWVPAASQMWLVGSGAAVMSVAVATTTLAPDFRIFPMLNGGIPLWVLTMVFILIDFAGITSGSYGIYLAHLAGAGIGFLFVKRLQKGYDWSDWMNELYDWVVNLFNPDKPRKSNDKKQEIYYNTRGKAPFRKSPNVTQQRVDELLDKINVHGYHFLTDEEKEFLKRASEEDL